MLNISELEVLKACIRWTDSEAARQSSTVDQVSKRAVFKSIKHLIRFGDLKLNELGSISELEDYLTLEEIGSIFVYLAHRRQPIRIDYRSPRQSRKGYWISLWESDRISGSESVRKLDVSFCVDQAVHLLSLQTFGISNCSCLMFDVFEGDRPLKLDAKIVPTLASSSKSFTIHLDLILEPQIDYTLQFSFLINVRDPDARPFYHSLGVTKNFSIKSGDERKKVLFKVGNVDSFQCIERIVFLCPRP